MSRNPLVSICIPTYNNGLYIGETLRSIINQTYKNFEIVVSDNASTDQTREVVTAFDDSRMRYYRSETHMPSGLGNFNRSIQFAKGDFIAVYHSDDIYEATIVQKELRFLLDHPEAGAVFARDTPVDKNNVIIKKRINVSSEIANKGVYDFGEVLRLMLKKNGSFLVCPTFMTRIEVLNQVGLFEAGSKYGVAGCAGDVEMWLRISRKFKIGVISEPLIRRRISATQDSSMYESTRITRANHFTVIDEYLASAGREAGIDKTLLAQYEFNKFFDDTLVAKNLLKLKRLGEAKRVLLRSFSLKRFLFGFKSVRNFCVLVIFSILLISASLGFPALGVGLYRFIHKYNPSVPG